MAARTVAAAPLTPLPELEQMVSRAGLKLNAGQLADLALAWRQVTELLGRLPRDWRLADDQAFVFRLPAPQDISPGGPRAGKTRSRRSSADTAAVKGAVSKKAPTKKVPEGKHKVAR